MICGHPSSIFNSSNVELIRILEFQVIPISHIASCILCQRSPNTFDVHVWCMTSAPWNKSSYVQECIPSSLRPWSHGISGIEKDKWWNFKEAVQLSMSIPVNICQWDPMSTFCSQIHLKSMQDARWQDRSKSEKIQNLHNKKIQPAKHWNSMEFASVL